MSVSSEDARFWLDVIAGFAAVAWAAGAWFVMRTASLCREPVEGVVEVDASPATVTSRVAQHLATVANGSPLHRSVVSSAKDPAQLKMHTHSSKASRRKRLTRWKPTASALPKLPIYWTTALMRLVTSAT